MKPRFNSAPITSEDFAIWCQLMARWALDGQLCALAPKAEVADRRDADLMLAAQCKRVFVPTHMDRRAPIRVGNIDCGWRLGRDWLS